MRRIFISYPFATDPEGCTIAVRSIARRLAMGGLLPLVPQIYLPQFLDEATERDMALLLCLKLVSLSDEVRVYGDEITEGMRLEIAEAERLGIPVVWGDSR